MNRKLATVLLLLMIIGLLFSMYFFSQGRFTEGMFLYPLLIAVYVMLKIGGRGSERTRVLKIKYL